MSSPAIMHRKEHPEYCKQDRIKDNERVQLYHNNPEYKGKVRQQA